ncbi:MAG: AMP-binding protein, partial [Proteobacteria bacterium]|nr:AMP-binding protein [Pseudomonadota bacterium]
MKPISKTTVALTQYNAEVNPGIPFLIFYDETITYKELDERTNAVANFLIEKGIGKGDIVSFMLGNNPGFFDTFLGIQKTGAVAGPVSCWWQADEVEYLVNDSRPKALVVDPEYVGIVDEIKDRIPSVETIIVNSAAPMDVDFPHETLGTIIGTYPKQLREVAAPEEDDTASLMYTSGTTGQPKGVMLSHKGVVYGAEIKKRLVPAEPGDRTLCVLPLFHSGGLNDLAIPSMSIGATIVLRRNFSAAEFWECVEKYRINGFYIVPTMWNILLRVPEASSIDTSSLKFGLSGAAPIPPEQLDECEKRFQVPIIEAYGSTENSGGITSNKLDSRKHGSIGKEIDGIDVRIFGETGGELADGEIGEIVTRGDTVMKGYFKNPQATADTIKDGWLYTGDLGYRDKDGFFFIVDRKKDMIIRGGVNVYPKELENIIGTHPKVAHVAVVPEPHDKYGQVAKACIVPNRGETMTEKEVREFCLKKMAEYKVPAIFIFREGLPTNPVGKVIKKDLLIELEEEVNAEAVPVAHLFEGMLDRFIPEQAKGVEATVSYTITGKGGGKWTVTIKDGKMTISQGILKEPRVYIVAKDADYHDIATGKIDGITAVMTGKMKIEGDVNFMAELREMMKPL